MENASNALLMAGGILIGILILSMMVYIFLMFVNYSSVNYERLEQAQIDQFNVQFLKYYGERTKEDGTLEPILCTAHDIITIANLAKDYNIANETENFSDSEINENVLYIKISIPSLDNNEYRENDLYKERQRVETWSSEQQLVFIKKGMKDEETGVKKYKCTKCEISNSTKRVYYMEFEEI